MRFPRLQAVSLQGDRRAIPDDLPDPVVLLLAFRQWQQRDIDAWIHDLEAAGVMDLFEIPLLGARWQPMRRFIDGGMAANIRDPKVLARTLTVYGQIGPAQSALSLPTRDQVYAVVVRSGEVVQMQAGPPGDPTDVIEAFRSPR